MFLQLYPIFFCTGLALFILQIEPDTNLAIHSSIFLYKVSNQNVQGEMSISYKNNNLIKVTTAKYISIIIVLYN